MPCLDIVLPKIAIETKRELCARLTCLMAEIAGFEPEILRIHFQEFEAGQVGTGGVLWEGDGVPPIHVVLYSPRLKRGVKRRLIEGFLREVPKLLGKPAWIPVVHLSEHPYDNVGGSGSWLGGRPELNTRKFYYDLPDD